MNQIIDRESVKSRSSALLKAHWQMPAVFMIIAIVVAFIPVVNLVVWPGLSYYFALLFIRCAPTGDFRLAKLDFKSREFIPILVVYVGWGIINAILLVAPFLIGMGMMLDDPIGGLLILLILVLPACGLSLYVAYRFAPLFLLPFVVIETDGEMEVNQIVKVCFFRYSKVKGDLFKFYVPIMICVVIAAFFLPAVFVIPFLIVFSYAHYYYSYLDLRTNAINSSNFSIDTEIDFNINTDARKKIKHCLRCGTNHSINAKFCDSCGNKFEEENAKETIVKPKEIPCEKCGTKNKENARFCISCGNKFGIDSNINTNTNKNFKRCLRCGTKHSINAKFCDSCGDKFEEEKVKENIAKPKEVPCERCGTKNKENARFCISCGNKFTKEETEKLNLCPRCGKNNTKDSLFCVFCGNKLNTHKTEPKSKEEHHSSTQDTIL